MIFVQCSSNPSKDLFIKIHVNGIDELAMDSLKYLDCRLYSAEIELSNNTDTLIRFWTMTCSWQDN
jgi:hypothetical protein